MKTLVCAALLLSVGARAQTSLSSVYIRARDAADAVKQREALEDVLPVQPEVKGDIPVLVEALRAARQAKDPKLCDSLPKPQKQTFHLDDYSMPAPGKDEWTRYCKALASGDGSLCAGINPQTHPNLAEECQVAIQARIAKSGSCKECYEQFYADADQAKSCLDGVNLTGAPSFYVELRRCLGLDTYPKDKVGSERDQCLFELARQSLDERLCLMIANPYEAYSYSTPNCRFALKKNP